MEYYTAEQMDAFAEEAGKELMVMSESGDIHEVADWWRRWYLKAGHKRLARMLMAIK